MWNTARATSAGHSYVPLQPGLGLGAVHAMDDAKAVNTAALLHTAHAFLEQQGPVVTSVVSRSTGRIR